MIRLKVHLTPGQLAFLRTVAYEAADRASSAGNMATALVAMDVWESLDKQFYAWEHKDTADVD